MSNATLAPWDIAKFAKLKASIADEADVRERLATWDADLIAHTKQLSSAKAALSCLMRRRDQAYAVLRSLIGKETATVVQSRLGELFETDDAIESANFRIREINSRGMSSVDRDNLVFRLAVIERVKGEMIDLSPFGNEIRDQQTEIRALSENGNAAKRLLLQVDNAKKSPYDNRHELVEHYTFLLERHNRKLAAMQANLEALLERVFS